MAVNGMAIPKTLTNDEVQSGRATFRDYVSLVKPGITAANLMATLAGLWVGSHGHPDPLIGLFALLGTALVVASGAALNNFVDRDIDHKMERTKARALATGKIPPSNALSLGLILGCLGIAVLVFLVNVVAAACALTGLIVYAYVYTVWLKRTSTLSTVLGGVAGAMPPLIGFAAGSGGPLDLAAWGLFFTFFLWQPPHFLPLAMKRSEEYRAAGIPMLPVVRGYRETKWQILSYTAAMVPVSLLLYQLHYEGIFYLLTALILGVIFIIRAVQGLFAKDDLAWANRLFKFSLLYLTAMCIAMMISAV
jgi:protoheme IX farnesyltransferase